MTGRVGNYKPAKGVSHAALRAAWLSLVATLILIVSVMTLFSSVALAHAAFVRSEPAPNSVLSDPPGAVTIWFTEWVEPGLSNIIVLDSTGRRVNTQEATVLPGDPDALTVPLSSLHQGTYTVAWKNFSRVDGHSLSGSFVFSVGVPLPTVPVAAPPDLGQPPVKSPAEVVARWLGLLSILAIIGFLVFELFIARPVLAADGDSKTTQSIYQQIESRMLNFTWLAAGIFFAASTGDLFVKTSIANNIPFLQALGRPMVSVLQTGWGNLWFWRMVILLGMLAVLVMASLDVNKHRLSGWRKWQMVGLVFAAGILFMISITSHAAAVTEIRAAAIFSDYLHLLAASVWAGDILYLTLIAPPVMKFQRKQMGGKLVSALFCPASHITAIGRFSILATLSIGILFITGVYNSWVQVTSFQAFDTPYGITLFIKLGLIVPLLLLGAVTSFYVRPRLGRDEKALQLLRKTVTAEAILATLVLLSVGILVSMEPARQTASLREGVQPNRLVVQEVAQGTNVKTVIEPGTLGPNLVTVFLMDQSGRPITNASAVTLSLTYLDRDIGTSTESTVDHGGGIWVAHQAVFSVAGNWQATVIVQRPDAFDVRTTFQFPVPFPTFSSTISPSAETGKWLWGVEMLLIGLLFGGVAITLRRWWTRAGVFFFLIGIASTITGLVMIVVA